MFSYIYQIEMLSFRYSVEFFQPPVKHEVPQQLGGYSSSSSLSNSSQSSGSLNSLDSQSSFSSSCTITAEQEERDLDADGIADDHVNANTEDVTSVPVDCDSNLSEQTGLQSDSGFESVAVDKTTSARKETHLDALLDQTGSSNCTKVDSGYTSAADISTSASTIPSRSASSSGTRPSSDKEFSSPVQPVLGIQTEDLDRTTPMFFLKPVTSDGIGVTGEDGARLEDKGKEDIQIESLCIFLLYFFLVHL